MRPPAVPELATADGHDRYVPSGTRDFLAVGHEGVYEWVAEHLVGEGSRVLDLGCGTGYGAASVTGAGATFDGVDGSPAAIDHARTHFDGPGVRFFAADLSASLPDGIEPGTYDLVMSSEVVEHLVDPFAFVRLMAAFTRDDGVAFVGTPNRLWSRDHMPDSGLMSRSHVMELTPPALVALLRTAFEEVTLLFRVFPEEAIRLAVVPPSRPAVVRGVAALAREVAPAALERWRRGRRRGPGGGPDWVAGDIAWVPADDPGVAPARAVGLAAVCRVPRR